MADPLFDPPRLKKILDDFHPQFYLIATVSGADFAINLYGTDDAFMPVFTNQQALDAFMLKFTQNLGMKVESWEIHRINDVEAVHQVATEKNLRVMIDPVIVSPTKTTWKERVKEGEIYKYRYAEN